MLGQKLADLRKEKNLSQYKLAELMNFSRGQIANYEQGSRKPDFETLQKFADFFDVSVDYLLGRTTTSNDEVLTKNINDIANQTKDLTEIFDRLKDQIQKDDLVFKGEPMTEQAKESLIESMEFLIKQAETINEQFKEVNKLRKLKDNN